MKTFASDNFSGVHPEVLKALAAANHGHASAYGADAYTLRAQELMKKLLGRDADIFFVFNGTAANVLALRASVPAYGAVICPSTAHINVDECGAPENIVGCRLLPVETPDGKLRPEQLAPLLHHKGDQHHSQPWAISISQTTELGTLYSLKELREICACAHSFGLLVHMDGARIANAVAALDCSLAEIVSDVDLLSWGGTKNGLLFGEAVVFLRPGLSQGFPFLRKQNMQLFSKMRFVGAQFCALLENDLWIQNARHANAMAARLEESVLAAASLQPVWPRHANALFVKLPEKEIVKLQQEHFFYVWDSETGVVRWMTSWDTNTDEIDTFVTRVSEVLANSMKLR